MFKDSLCNVKEKTRDKFGTDLGKFWTKIRDRSRGHLAASLINHYCVYHNSVAAAEFVLVPQPEVNKRCPKMRTSASPSL